MKRKVSVMLRFLAYAVECFIEIGAQKEKYLIQMSEADRSTLFLKYPSRDVKYYMTSMESITMTSIKLKFMESCISPDYGIH